ncbi:hypothetical protein [Ectobacillus panaciterrae]|uniref:hypothetical protein n=1 Tax=Ectobacillus panaciterrae TaxID=363872 RepID=UPI0004143C02|nr:hypothetical protein [Ectobacillus panaciterrae]
MNKEALFLTIVQQSEFKKGASLAQLMCFESEEAEELVDDYGYEAILAREHDDELEDILGEELFNELEYRVFAEGSSRDKLISFVNGLGFHLLDWIVILETECGIPNEAFTPDVTKKMERRLPHFPYLDEEKTIFDLTVRETAELLQQVTDGQAHMK